jgi:hypothetical protein
MRKKIDRAEEKKEGEEEGRGGGGREGEGGEERKEGGYTQHLSKFRGLRPLSPPPGPLCWPSASWYYQLDGVFGVVS